MDPYIWERQSLSIWHDHPYCRSPYLEPINFICVEPSFKYSTNCFVNSQPDSGWIEVVNDSKGIKCRLMSSYTSPIKSHLPKKFTTAPPILHIDQCSAIISHTSALSIKNEWNISSPKLIKCLRKVLIRADLEVSVYKEMFSEDSQMDRDFRQNSHYTLTIERVARSIRKTFAYLHWCIDTCAIIHEHILNRFPSNLLSIYLEGFVLLVRQNKIKGLISALNSEIYARGNIFRFSYQEFVDWLDKNVCEIPKQSSQSLHFSRRAFQDRLPHNHTRHYQQRSEIGGASTINFTPASFLPGQSHLGNCSRDGELATTSTSPMTVDVEEPIFVCLLGPKEAKSKRINRILHDLSQIGRIAVEITMDERQPCENFNETLEMHTAHNFNRRVLAVMTESKSAPIYLIGFGLTCLSIVATALQLPSCPGLERVLSGQITAAENPVPTKPWLSGLICLGMPFLRAGSSLESLALVGRKCSLLMVVGERSSKSGVVGDDAQYFRDRLIAARRRCKALPSAGGQQDATGDHAHWQRGGRTLLGSTNPHEFDLQLMIVGGADQLLRAHTLVLRRWSTNQAAIDAAITKTARNFINSCRNLSNNNYEVCSGDSHLGLTSSSDHMGTSSCSLSSKLSLSVLLPGHKRMSTSTAFSSQHRTPALLPSLSMRYDQFSTEHWSSTRQQPPRPDRLLCAATFNPSRECGHFSAWEAGASLSVSPKGRYASGGPPPPKRRALAGLSSAHSRAYSLQTSASLQRVSSTPSFGLQTSLTQQKKINSPKHDFRETRLTHDGDFEDDPYAFEESGRVPFKTQRNRSLPVIKKGDAVAHYQALESSRIAAASFSCDEPEFNSPDCLSQQTGCI